MIAATPDAIATKIAALRSGWPLMIFQTIIDERLALRIFRDLAGAAFGAGS